MRLLILGLGYTGSALAQAVRADGGVVLATTQDGRDGTIDFADAGAVRSALAAASHVVSTIPPDAAGDDPVLLCHANALGGRWLGYLSSTGVYGDTGGAWVDESAVLGGRRPARVAADVAWLALGARVFRLPGIYGQGRSPLDRVRRGEAHRVALPDQVFSRVHVADIVACVIAGFAAPAGAYNLADDRPAPQDEVVAFAAELLGLTPPPIVPLAKLSPASRSFYAENRRVANGKAKRVLGWQPRFPDYRAGLRALNAISNPAPASTAPAIARPVQR